MAVYLQAPALPDEYPVHESLLKLIHNGSVKDRFMSRIFAWHPWSPTFILFVASDDAYDDDYSGVCCLLWCVGHHFITGKEQGAGGRTFNNKTHTRIGFVDSLLTNIGLIHNMQCGCEASMQHISSVHCELYTVQTNTLYINIHKNNSSSYLFYFMKLDSLHEWYYFQKAMPHHFKSPSNRINMH